jgi:hypothetical protein
MLIAVYGLGQSVFGLLPWDRSWVNVAGYTALHVGNSLRPFGTFSSNAEYAAYLAIAIVVAVAMAFGRRRVAVMAVPILAVAVLVASIREVVIATLIAIAVMLGLKAIGDWPRLALILAGIGGLVVALWTFGPVIETGARAAGNPLLVHQVGGLLHPFDPDQSTLPLHWDRIVAGLSSAVDHPLGSGTAVTTLAASKLGAQAVPTDVDVANVFVSLGIPGGGLYVAMLVAIAWKTLALYRATRQVVVLGVVGVLIVTLGQWLNGGEYAVAPLVWFLVGWITAEWRATTERRWESSFVPAPVVPPGRRVSARVAIAQDTRS